MPRGPKGERRPSDASQLAHRIIQIATGQEEDALPPAGQRSGGLAGAQARSDSLTPERRSEIARKASLARWIEEEGTVNDSKVLTAEEVLEEIGGVQVLLDGLNRFQAVHDYYDANAAALTEQYPHKWAVIIATGVVAVSDTLEGALEHARQKRLSNPDFILKFLNPSPPNLIL